MQMSVTIILSFLLSFGLFARKNDPIVAKVNGEEIYKSDLENTYDKQKYIVTDRPTTRDAVLNDLINRQLGIQKAKKNKLESNDLVRKKTEDILYHAQVSRDLEPRLRDIKVSDEEVKEYYKHSPEYRTSQILFRLKVNASKEEIQDMMARALDAYNRLKAHPELFAEIANKESMSSSALNGGDMGYLPAVRMAPEYFKAIKQTKIGQITPPVRTQLGFHIIKVIALRSEDEIDMSLYKKIIFDQKRDTLLNEYFKELRKGASIKIEKKYLE
ncbi:MAG: peptidylprolyl isomerase [Halobacteriovoraceae bacterium]|nr:peptidylprolyl isomerase [Halobacteriovoraceae bacterium]